MTAEIYKSDRYFTIFDYKVSHGQMLLRSDKRKGGGKNIDIIFYDTSFVQVFTMLFGITVRIADKSVLTNYDSVKKYLSREENNLFTIESGGEIYYVAASFVKVYENVLDFNESSLECDDNALGREIARSFF